MKESKYESYARAEETSASITHASEPSEWFLSEYPRRMSTWIRRIEAGGNQKADLERRWLVGQELVVMREERNIDRQTLSEMTGLSSDLLFFMENGMAKPAEALLVLERIERFLDFDVSRLRVLLCDASGCQGLLTVTS